MAKGFTVEIEGLQELKRKYDQLPTKLRKDIGAEIGFAAEEIKGLAQEAAPADQGILRNEISVEKIDELNYEVISGAEYSPFVEFGTRHKTQIPPGLEEFASDFAGGGNIKTPTSLTAKEAIFAWCERKGIEKKIWYAIYVSLMVKGVTPHPFFFKQGFIVKPKLEANIQNVLNNQ
jgi:hypothetical protein